MGSALERLVSLARDGDGDGLIFDGTPKQRPAPPKLLKGGSQPTRKVVKEFRAAGWNAARSSGSHTIWKCPSGKHTYVLPDGHRSLSVGVVSKGYKTIAACVKEES